MIFCSLSRSFFPATGYGCISACRNAHLTSLPIFHAGPISACRNGLHLTPRIRKLSLPYCPAARAAIAPFRHAEMETLQTLDREAPGKRVRPVKVVSRAISACRNGLHKGRGFGPSLFPIAPPPGRRLVHFGMPKWTLRQGRPSGVGPTFAGPVVTLAALSDHHTKRNSVAGGNPRLMM